MSNTHGQPSYDSYKQPQPYKPIVRFSRMAYERMMSFVHACNIEVSGFGVTATAEQRAAKGVKEAIYITEIHIAEQDCTGATTDLRATALGELMMRLRDNNKNFNAINMNVWWHSHVDMEPSPSPKDINTFNAFDFDEIGIMVIANKKGKIFTRIQVYKPLRYIFEQCDCVVDSTDIIPEGWANAQIKKYVFTSAPRFVDTTYIRERIEALSPKKRTQLSHKKGSGKQPSKLPNLREEPDNYYPGFAGYPIDMDLFDTDIMDPTMSHADLLFLAHARATGRINDTHLSHLFTDNDISEQTTETPAAEN